MIKRTAMRTVNVAILLGLMVVLLASPAGAQGTPPTDDQVNAIAKQLYCPVCENTPLDVCPTQACAQWRDVIRQKLTDGWNEEQIKQYFIDQYGDRVSAAPPATGFNWLIYALPPLIFVAAAVGLFRVIARWRKSEQDDAPAADPSDDPYLQQLEEALRQQD